MINPSALNFVTIGAMTLIFIFLWKMSAAALVKRNMESPLGKAMAAVI